MKYFDAKIIDSGMPYISMKSEMKNAVTKPFSAQLAFLLYESGIRNAVKSIIDINAISQCPVIKFMLPVRYA